MNVSFARRSAVAAALMMIGLASTANAQTATQTVTFAVNAIRQIAFTGTPSLTITTATAGSAPTQATDNTAKWAITTNVTGAKVSASLSSAMPSGVTLSVNLTAPGTSTSLGLLALSATSVDLVTGIAPVAQANLAVSYALDATVAAGVVASATRIVTYTISGGA